MTKIQYSINFLRTKGKKKFMATTYNSDGQKTNRPSCMPASLNKYYILVNE